MTRAERARDLFFEGCNCAQAVFLAFAEDPVSYTHLTLPTILRV